MFFINRLGVFSWGYDVSSAISDLEDKLVALNDVDRIILLLAASGNKPIKGALWLQKELYLIQKAFPQLAEDTGFEPHMFGPYSEIIADEVEQLKESNLMELRNEQPVLTENGKKIASVLAEKANKKIIEKINEFKEFMNDMSADELLAYTYFTHEKPEELEKESIPYKRLLGKRKQLALSLYFNEKISAQKAAQVAGLDLEDFLVEVKKAVQ